jgi:chromosome segregation protein
MKLTRLDIVGFKSFAEKVTLHFSDGITSVVGPNGCGKSNIVDAIRWAMGEQSAKHLRGGKMEDVIFNGSESRGPMGLAEVTLTLKNDGVVPPDYADYDEIAVRRRLFRDGTSEYSINKTPVRLKDVTDLFLGTGVGTRAYSMIEQGRIGFIVNSKPEERRFLIEEVAGITKYKARKKLAQRRMEATEQNLLRVNDIVTELGRQIGSLERQAQKAEKFKKLRQELRDLELHLASLRYFELRNAQVFHASEHERFAASESEIGVTLATVDTRLEANRVELQDVESDNARRAEQVHALERRFSVLEKDLEFFAREREGLKDQGTQAAQEAESQKTHKQTVEQEIGVLEDHARVLGEESQSVLGDLTYKEARQREVAQQRRSLEARANDLQKQMIDALTALAKERAQLQSFDQRRIELGARVGRGSAEQAELERQVAEQREQHAQVNRELVRLGAQDVELKAHAQALEEQTKRSKQQLTFAEAKLLQLKEEAGERKSRLQSLMDIEKKYEGYGTGVRAIMTRDGELREHGIFGLVADVLSASSEFEPALEAVLGERLQYVLVESQKRGLEAVDYLKAQAEGRSSFIPLDMVAARHDQRRPRSETPAGAVRLRDRVQAREGYEAVADYLLADVVVVPDLPAALAAQLEGWSCVTTDGEVIDRQGVLSGGAGAGVSEGLLAQKREIKDLGEDVRRLENEILLAENEKAELAAELLRAEQFLKQTNAEWHETQIKKAKTEKDLHSASEQTARLELRQQQVARDIAELTKQQEALESDAAGCQARMAQAESVHAQKEGELSQLTEQDATLRDDEQRAQEALTQLKVAFAQKDEKQKNVLRTLERLTQSLADTEARIQRAHHAVQTGSQRAKELTEKLRAGEEERGSLLDLLDQGKQELQGTRQRYEQLAQEVRALEERSRSLAREAGRWRDERVAAEMRSREHVMLREHLLQQIADSYQLDLAHEVIDFHLRAAPDGDAPERVAGLKQQLARMGDINLTAIAEFAQVKERHDFLSTQKEDLESALTQLRSAILKINRTSRERFLEAFNATNTMFQKIFPRLFRGGEARLELVQDGSDDILEAGIDIIAQPPGKKLGSVQLLSGGEKALTAVSLVFAIFLIKPSPFCVLDEVDAPLDEGNVGRFNELLREISHYSQFIVITHNKHTMECAHRLYGITMDEPGISKLVSVNLQREEAEQAAAV